MTASATTPDPFLDLPDGTCRVTQLANQITRALAVSVGTDIWVAGEVSGKRKGRNGEVYFDLVDRDDPSRPPQAAVGARASRNVTAKIVRDCLEAGVRITDGTPVRLRARPSLWKPTGKISLDIIEIDVAWTVGRQLLTRSQVLAALRAEGVLDIQPQRQLTDVPLDVAVITAWGSHAAADFEGVLTESGFAFRVLCFDTRVQGQNAPAEIAAALRASARVGSWTPDVVVCLRGGGARTDLAAWDDPTVARAIAAHDAPVIVAVGHELDSSVADAAAWRSTRTPTDAARFLVRHVQAFLDSVNERHTRIADTAGVRLDRLDQRLAALPTAALTIAAARLSRLDETHVQTARHTVDRANRIVLAADDRLERRTDRIAAGAATLLQRCASHLDVAAATVGAADPARILARGFSVTRTADGTLVRGPGDVADGIELVTQLASGSVDSTVTRVRPAETTAP